MDAVALLGLLVLGVVVLTPVAERIGVPQPVVLTIYGLVLGVIPFVPAPQLDPELVLPLVLPPLLFAATQSTSVRELRAAARPILGLAVGLTLVSAIAVAVVGHALGLPWAVAAVLGAVVSPPDPVAASAVASRLHLPPRLVTLLEGEGQFNDATALVHLPVVGDGCGRRRCHHRRGRSQPGGRGRRGRPDRVRRRLADPPGAPTAARRGDRDDGDPGGALRPVPGGR